ncbi:SpvB/TcaC N-terminal domain-containing protein [Arsenophonus nasoniae]|uniref:Mono(ADP-ribosyl)transferase SpvB n=2 Tax=Arsenophonus nasoniae TaxID=638 RepID=A0A4P7KVA9_9GAMM|nr:SpvB/TcaC N-terminal domain-containing protein [Arsenophonus nasoniae]QBY44085.1 Mono(ADP-ribosyl)transferase SpvB [Arsenophonus nasoniae]WGM04393.1 SpvB/TcaC N-terminal domain-containing protein [Arsenophonus nasoniae]WGM09497.1 SpvB/TcaC N-terminal domain-containing protein [Arsenophonus nasoniae]WGM14218.1 SpvB/TcaC N-terminal domain-containing protein [Arsenophonus nasoniae]
MPDNPNNQDKLSITPLSLPKGGGSLQGMGETVGTPGPDGMVHITLPLPISSGRGYAPSLNLNYNSGSGNSAFAIGWNIDLPSIRRQTSHGRPLYQLDDTFIGIDNEVLVVAVDQAGQPIRYQKDSWQNIKLTENYQITQYQSRIGTGAERVEYWQPVAAQSSQMPFWLIYSPDGQIHCLGKSANARIFDPNEEQHIAVWLLEESVSPNGEHILYQHQAENDQGTSEQERLQHPSATAQRYLTTVSYGNLSAYAPLYSLTDTIPPPTDWLFYLILDYGERSNQTDQAPEFLPQQAWSMRQDPFSRFEYGFEIRTRRLCQQVLMFHDLQRLQDLPHENRPPALVRRLQLHYDQQAIVSQLIRCRQLAHDGNNSLLLPPIEFDYQLFGPPPAQDWQPLIEFNSMKDQQQYYLVDLYGEGIAGILYQDNYAWYYRDQIRGQSQTDEITYSPPQQLPNIPTLLNGGTLMDINGDGRLEWFVNQINISGYYAQHPDRSWSDFIPLLAIPTELQNNQAQFADITGAGLADITLIGPKSVRFYANQRQSFATAVNCPQAPSVALPIIGRDERQLVAFSDLLGSGQQHLVSIRHNEVTCWPNLGQGLFGAPIQLSGFQQPQESFDPKQLYLADLDGSGTTDIIYLMSDHLLIYMNQSGNSFAAPFTIPLPNSVAYDDTCQLWIADIQGLGVASLILSIPHMQQQHWRYDLASQKPYLLNRQNNNCGTDSRFYYRSSVQFWLDEKQQAIQQNKSYASHLPFPIQLLNKINQLDEITMSCFSQSVNYFHGMYDGIEREFRGFGRVDIVDSTEDATGNTDQRSMPSLLRQWFHIGNTNDEVSFSSEYWQGDKQAFPVGNTRLTQYQQGQDIPISSPDEEQKFWAYRSLKGSPLRSELYGLDHAADAENPYSVTYYRYQVRQIPAVTTAKTGLAMAPMSLEQWDYNYERIAEDPLFSQNVNLAFDENGSLIHNVAINYPRRPGSIIPPSLWLPEGAFEQSYDPQQQLLRISENQIRYHNLKTQEQWRLNIADEQRTDMITLPASDVPTEGFSLESLLNPDGILSENTPREYAGQSKIYYLAGGENTPISVPTLQALVAFTEQAEFDQLSLAAFEPVLSEAQIEEYLTNAGYVKTEYLFPRPGEENKNIWVTRLNYSEYYGAEGFYCPYLQRHSLLTGATDYQWHTYYCGIVSTTDAAGYFTHADYDYRFLTPYQIIDINDNISYANFDAFGRVSSSRI